MNITQIGIDLAKMLFQVHGVDARGKVLLRKQLKRQQMMAFFAQLPQCLIGMEACGGSHYWARKLTELGHTVKLGCMAAIYSCEPKLKETLGSTE